MFRMMRRLVFPTLRGLASYGAIALGLSILLAQPSPLGSIAALPGAVGGLMQAFTAMGAPWLAAAGLTAIAAGLAAVGGVGLAAIKAVSAIAFGVAHPAAAAAFLAPGACFTGSAWGCVAAWFLAAFLARKCPARYVPWHQRPRAAVNHDAHSGLLQDREE